MNSIPTAAPVTTLDGSVLPIAGLFHASLNDLCTLAMILRKMGVRSAVAFCPPKQQSWCST